jgi:hypothetical protein
MSCTRSDRYKVVSSVVFTISAPSHMPGASLQTTPPMISFITKPFAWGEGDSGGHVLREATLCKRGSKGRLKTNKTSSPGAHQCSVGMIALPLGPIGD